MDNEFSNSQGLPENKALKKLELFETTHMTLYSPDSKGRRQTKDTTQKNSLISLHSAMFV